jgi:precorrin-6B methylase 2
VANEVERRRQQALQENLWKWGLPNVVVTGSDPAALQALPDAFDLVVVDAPCSGEGMFRKDPFARHQWSEHLVAQCATTQERIVEQAWHALRPGGVLIYSTCTWETSENEQRVAELAQRGAQPLPLAMDPAWGVVPVTVEGITAYRCYPHRVRGEGFFLAAVRKPGDARVTPRIPVPGSGDPTLRNWLVDADRWWLTGQDGTLYAVDARWQAVLHELQQTLRVVAPGRPLAVEHAGLWRPHPALALDTALRRGAFPELEVDSATALRYLRGEALPATAAAGQARVVYAGLPLGWVNGAGNRWNNGWPTTWRIRMQVT